jgi:hypothetical protein
MSGAKLRTPHLRRVDQEVVRNRKPEEFNVLEIIALFATVGVTLFGYFRSRSFVQRRLTYVDAIQTAGAPILIGIAAAVVATPVTWVLPLVGSGTAMLFGAGIGAGVAAGRRQIRHRLRPG